MLNKNFEKKCIEFLKKNRHDDKYINPHWKMINDSIPNVSLNQSLQNIVDSLNKKDRTKYLSKNFDRNLANDILSEKYQLYDEPTAGAFKFLRIKKLLDNYLKTLEDLNWSPTMVNARHFYYASIIKKYLLKKRKSKIRVLEIGGGTGQLVIFLRKFFNIDYVNIDFPDMLLLNAFENKIISTTEFIYKLNDYKNVFKGNTSRYATPKIFLENINVFKNFDLYLNCHSFMEMDKEVRDKYILASDKVLIKQGYFFNVNWTQIMTNIDGSTYFNNPLTYPYPINFDCLLRNEDRIHGYMRRFANYKTTGVLGFVTLLIKKNNLLNITKNIKYFY